MEQSALRRARLIREWSTCAPRFVSRELDGILRRADLPDRDRARVESWLVGLELGEPGTWVCRFPALAGADAPSRLEGGLLSIVATDPGVLPPRGSAAAADVLDLAGMGPSSDLHVLGMPTPEGRMVVGSSAGAAAWLAQRARATGRTIPRDVVVSAALLPGPDGEPCLAAVTGGGAKARVVAREVPGAKLFLCGDADGEDVVALPVGAPVREIERLVWGAAAVTDRTELTRIGGLARAAFDAHDYATAATRYQEVASSAGGGDVELHHEACLRLAAVAVHAGLPGEADTWLHRSAELERSLPRSKRGIYAVERISTLAGRAIDGFRPRDAERLLETDIARHAAVDPTDTWKPIQVRGAWRRLHLLNGAPKEARKQQLSLLEVTADDRLEHPRALVDLGFVETRCGDLDAAQRAFLAGHEAIEGMPPIYALQSHAFLVWHLARYALRGGDLEGLADLLVPRRLDALLADPQLQAAGRWRVEAVRAGASDALDSLAGRLTPFQRWYLAVFLLETPATDERAQSLLALSSLDLSGMPVLAKAQEDLRAGHFEPAPFLTFAAY